MALKLGILPAALWLAAPMLFGQTTGAAATVIVPATSNPYLAGMPRGTKARVDDRAPEQSPVLVQLSLKNAVAVSFRASGAVQHGPYNPPQFDPPEGSLAIRHEGGAEHGISDIKAPINSLLGVFLGDDPPDRSRAPKPLNLRAAGRNRAIMSPQLKQVFYIGDGTTRKGENRRFLVPKDATRLFLGTMDGFDWSNDEGSFMVTVTIERAETTSNIFSVDSTISFAVWACLPDRSQCTPDRPAIKEQGPGQYHVILPAQLEWGVSIPTPVGASVQVNGARGTVCLDAEALSTSSCNGPQGNGTDAGADFLSPDDGIGSLVRKTTGDRTYFSVNDRSGDAFQKHEGYFEFDVSVK